MNNLIEYRGYVGSVEFSEGDGVFFGRVQGIRSLISYEGTNAAELVGDFHGAVDDYLALCEEEGTAPEVAYKGGFNVRFKKRDNPPEGRDVRHEPRAEPQQLHRGGRGGAAERSQRLTPTP